MKGKRVQKKFDRNDGEIPEQLKPLLKVHAKLTEPNLTATDIRARLHITQRQLNYMESVLYPGTCKKKATWRRYSIIDLLCIKVVKSIVKPELPGAVIGILFVSLKDWLEGDYTLLIDIAKGREIVVFFDHSNLIVQHIFVLPNEEKAYLKMVKSTRESYTAIFLGSILRKELTKIATNDFSADIDEKTNKITYKIEGEKIRIDEIPDNLYKELDKIKNMVKTSDSNG